MAYIYLHKRNDNAEVFYVGLSLKDSLKRAKSRSGRNKIWERIVNKTSYEIIILFYGYEESFVKTCEIELISLYKRKCEGGTLANLTLGGEGVQGYSHPAWNKGLKVPEDKRRKGYKMSEEFKEGCSKRAKDKIEKNGHFMLGKKHSEFSKIKQSNSKLGKKQSELQRQKISETRAKTKVGKFVNDVLVESFESIKEAAISCGITTGLASKYVNNIVKPRKKRGYELKKI